MAATIDMVQMGPAISAPGEEPAGLARVLGFARLLAVGRPAVDAPADPGHG